MAFNSDGTAVPQIPIILTDFPHTCLLETTNQIRRFELLRLAFFALKLRKLQQRSAFYIECNEYEFHCNLLQHAIFQQILTLTALDAREQALRLIDICRK